MRFPSRSAFVRKAAAALCTTAVGAMLVSCSGADASVGATSATATPSTPVANPTIDPSALAARGQLISSEPMDDIDSTITDVGATATRIVYSSVSGVDGTATQVSGVVFVPTAPAPAGGRPVVTFGHGTTGVYAECGPSLHSNLLGYASTIVPLMKLGYVAVMSDYQGLGTTGTGQSGIHPYLEPNTAAFNLIDAVRAARAFTPDASSKWAAFGVSQGGQASWSAAELADFYGSGLDFVGSVALSPAVDLTDEAALASSNFLSREQQVAYPTLIYGLTTAVPAANKSDFLHGVLAQDPDAWTACTPPGTDRRGALAPQLNRSDSRPSSEQARNQLQQWLSDIALPKRPASGPLLVINGDADQTVRPQWVQTAVDNACALGDQVQHIVRAGQGHGNLDPGAETAIWLEARFRGDPAPNDC